MTTSRGGPGADTGSTGQFTLGTYTVDTVPPIAPGSLDLAAADDSGTLSTDNLTKQTSGLTITGTGEPAPPHAL